MEFSALFRFWQNKLAKLHKLEEEESFRYEEVSVPLSEMLLLHVMKRDVKWGVHLDCEYAFELTEHDCRVQPFLRQARLLKISVGNL